MLRTSVLVVVACILFSAGCRLGQQSSSIPVDVRTILESQVEPGEGLQQTQFAYIGTVDTPDGYLYVTTQRLVLTGMLQPRGQGKMHLFDENYELVDTYWLDYFDHKPLWCEGTKIYLFGNSQWGRAIPPSKRLAALFDTPDEEYTPTGNVVDFSKGAHKPMLRREKRYGSSGGVNHDPWDVELD